MAVSYIFNPFTSNFDAIDTGTVAGMTDWVDYTLVIGGSTSAPTPGTNTAKASWRRVGDSMQIRYVFTQTAGGSDGSGAYLFPLPAGYAIDTAKLKLNTVNNGTDGSPVGTFVAANTSIVSTNNASLGSVIAYDTTNLAAVVNVAAFSQLSQVGSTGYQLSTPTIHYQFLAEVPISGWTAGVAGNPSIAPTATFTATSSWTTAATYGGRYRLVGDTLEIQVFLTLTTTPPSAILNINIPAGFTIDTTKLAGGTASNQALGIANMTASGAGFFGQCRYVSTTAVQVAAISGSGSYSSVTDSFPGAFGAGDTVSVNFSVPVL